MTVDSINLPSTVIYFLAQKAGKKAIMSTYLALILHQA